MDEEYNLPKRYGFVNIGNTCYMNAGLQMLRSVPQFKDLLNNLAQVQVSFFLIKQNNPSKMLATSLKSAIKDLDLNDVNPKMFVALFLNSNPEFQPFGTQQDSD